MKFRKYQKIHRLGKEETDGILDGICYVQEKIDGANASIWMDDHGVIQCGSRNRHLIDDDFNGFVKYVKNHSGINNFLESHYNLTLYGEWLVQHTVQYSDKAYKKFYLFDVLCSSSGGFADPVEVESIAGRYGINCVPTFGKFDNPSTDQIIAMVGKSQLSTKGEGVVIKNMEFVNKFCDLVYAKVVSADFKEMNLLAFEDNDKHFDSYNEMYFVNKYMTIQRVEKVVKKLQPEINGRLSMKHIPRICETAYHDMLAEEIWDVSKKIESINFKKLRNIAYKKAKMIYMDILSGINFVDLG